MGKIIDILDYYLEESWKQLAHSQNCEYYNGAYHAYGNLKEILPEEILNAEIKVPWELTQVQ